MCDILISVETRDASLDLSVGVLVEGRLKYYLLSAQVQRPLSRVSGNVLVLSSVEVSSHHSGSSVV